MCALTPVAYSLCNCSVKATIERYKKATSDNSSAAGTVAEVTIQVHIMSISQHSLSILRPGMATTGNACRVAVYFLNLVQATFLVTVASSAKMISPSKIFRLVDIPPAVDCSAGHYTIEISVICTYIHYSSRG